MSIQPELTPAQQAVRDAIEAWRASADVPAPSGRPVDGPTGIPGDTGTIGETTDFTIRKAT